VFTYSWLTSAVRFWYFTTLGLTNNFIFC